jgi:hypothetical protein
MTITLADGTTALLLLAVVPFLAVIAVFMLTAVLSGPKGNFRLILTFPWLLLVLPTVLAGLWGIMRAAFQ